MLHFPKNTYDVGYKTWQLTKLSITVNGLRTTYYGPKKRDASKKSLLLVHGLGGDHHGIMPFSYQLQGGYNVYIVELPGHGDTDIPSDKSYTFWKQWTKALLPTFAQQQIVFDEVIAHSFGCLVASMMEIRDIKLTMLMPVPRSTKTYLGYIRMMYTFRYFIAPWYGWYPFAVSRGIVLAYEKSRQSLDVIRWVSGHTYYSARQFRYQTKLALDMDGFYLFDKFDDEMIHNLRIVMGSHDTFSTEDYFDVRRDVPRAHVQLLPGGHLLPIETPELLAHELYDV